MIFSESTTRIITSVILGLFLLTQVLIVTAPLLIPKPAKAWTITNVTLMDVWQAAEKILIGIAKQLALRVAEKFITKFMNKIVEKYKIRNYLYYHQVLTNYYLNNFIRDKIKDPELQQIYALLEAAYITGASTGTTGQPNPNNALIPRLKKKISDLYIKQGGIDPNLIYNPPASYSTGEYFKASQAFYFNPPSFTASNLQGTFGAFQSEATTAAQLEVLVGNGLKAGRFIGGTCKLPTTGSGQTVTNGLPPGMGGADPNSSPQACKAAGGTWQPSALDQARSFIDSPSTFINGWLNSVIKRKIDNNYDPNNFWSTVGALLGNFLFDQLALNRNQGVLNEDPRQYSPEETPEDGTPIDLDNDGLPDGYDFDNDGKPDFCVYGGTAPECKKSSESTNPPGSGGGFIDCDNPPAAISPDPTSVAVAVRDEFFGGGAILSEEDREKFTAIVAWRLHQGDEKWGRKRAAGPVSNDTVGYLRPEMGPGRFEAVDLLSGSTGEIQRGCYGLVDAGQTWIQPVPAP
jgi:hypothetical protein